MKKVTIQYFAVLKDMIGKPEEEFETNAAKVSDLFTEICEVYKMEMPQAQLRVAVNDDFCEWDALIHTGDKIVFIPPVSGG